MSLFEKIEFDPIEVAAEPPPRSSHIWKGDEILSIRYLFWPKPLILFLPFALLPFFPIFLQEGIFFLELLLVGAVIVCLWLMAEWLLTLSITFYPDRIVKRTPLGKLAIPTSALYVSVKEQDLHLFHVSEKNIRESIKIHRHLMSDGDHAAILGYLQDIYQIRTYKLRLNGLTDRPYNQLATDQYLKSAESYRLFAAFFVVFIIIAVFTVGFSETFFGVAPSLPVFPIRLALIALAIAAFFQLRQWAAALTGSSQFETITVMNRLERAHVYAVNSALLAVIVAGLGLLLFVLFGNTLDLYIFLIVGGLYFYDCYPRLSTWERLSAGKVQPEAAAEERPALPRRSVQVSLVLMGALAVMSYGENGHYLYANRKDCQDDWGDTSCQELPAGSGYSESGGEARYYGPRYGTGYGKPTRALGLGPISRGGFGSLGSFHASFGG